MKTRILFLTMFIVLTSAMYAQELRTEFFDAKPNYMQNKDKTFTGLSYDLMKLVENDTGIKFIYPSEFVPLKRVVANLQVGATDIQFGLALIPEQEKSLRQVETMYSVSFSAIARKGETLTFKTMEDFSMLKKSDHVLAVFGTTIASLLKENTNITVDDGGKDFDENITKLIGGRGRVFVSNNMTISYFMKYSPYREKLTVVGKDLNPISHYISFSQKVDPKLIERVESSVKKLKKNGSWQKVIDSYLKY